MERTSGIEPEGARPRFGGYGRHPIKERYFVSKFGYDPQIVPALNRTILATTKIKAVIDVRAPLSGANFTTDGVHLNRLSRDWK
jgi:hypothetical protein